MTTAILRLHFSRGDFLRRADAGTKEVGRKIDVYRLPGVQSTEPYPDTLLIRRSASGDTILIGYGEAD